VKARAKPIKIRATCDPAKFNRRVAVPSGITYS